MARWFLRCGDARTSAASTVMLMLLTRLFLPLGVFGACFAARIRSIMNSLPLLMSALYSVTSHSHIAHVSKPHQ